MYYFPRYLRPVTGLGFAGLLLVVCNHRAGAGSDNRPD